MFVQLHMGKCVHFWGFFGEQRKLLWAVLRQIFSMPVNFLKQYANDLLKKSYISDLRIVIGWV